MVNKHYPQQFKADAVALYRSRPGATIALIADDLGVNRETLRSWVRADDQRRGARASRPAAVAGEAAGSVEDENAQLRRRVRELEEESDILRKAARYSPGGRAGDPLAVRGGPPGALRREAVVPDPQARPVELLLLEGHCTGAGGPRRRRPG